MRITSHRLRSKIIKKRTVAEEDAFLKEKFERARRHRFLAILVGFTGSFNLTTSLLTPVVFNCENFSSKCAMAYTTGYNIAFILTTFFVSYKSSYLFMALSTLATSLGSHAVIGALGSGNTAKNLFILVYWLNGFLAPFLTQATSFVTNRYLLSTAFSGTFVGSGVARIGLNTLQAVLEKNIGSETVQQCRRILVLCHSIHSIVAYIGAIWAFILYLECKKVDKEIEKREKEKKKTEESSASSGSSSANGGENSKWGQIMTVLPYMKHVPWRILTFWLSHGLLYFYYPCTIPFCLNIPRPMKIICSIIFTYCDLIGRSLGSTMDKEVDEKDKKDSQTHKTFLFFKHLKYILLILVVHVTLLSLLMITWNNHEYSRTPLFIYPVILFGALGFGMTMTGSMNSINSAIAYFNRNKEGNDGEKIIPDEVKKYSNVMIDVVNFCDGLMLLGSTTIGGLFMSAINRHRTSRQYLIENNTRGLTETTIDMILNNK